MDQVPNRSCTGFRKVAAGAAYRSRLPVMQRPQRADPEPEIDEDQRHAGEHDRQGLRQSNEAS